MRGLDLARRIPSGIVHINDQTVDAEPTVPLGGALDSGHRHRLGRHVNLEAFTKTRWVDAGRYHPISVLGPDQGLAGLTPAKLVVMNAEPSMSLPEWLVLAISASSPSSVSRSPSCRRRRRTRPVWQIRRRSSTGRWAAPQHRPGGPAEHGQGLGPQRTIYAATPEGSAAARRWLHTPVAHVRDIRSHLLLKLALLDRAGDDPADLLREQRTVLGPIAEAIEDQRAQSGGFEATLLAWRRATAVAALDFLEHGHGTRRGTPLKASPRPQSCARDHLGRESVPEIRVNRTLKRARSRPKTSQGLGCQAAMVVWVVLRRWAQAVSSL